MKQTMPRTDTGLYVPVHRAYETEDHPIPPTEKEINASIDAWTGILLIAMIGVFSMAIAWGLGWLDSPDQKLTQQNQQLSEQLNQTQGELESLKACLSK